MNSKLYIPELTEDGSYTFFSKEFGEAFHSHYGAAQEAIGKFVIPCQLKEKALINQELKLLDICYGLGYNSAAALDTIWQVNPKCRVELIALELEPQVPKSAIAHQLLNKWQQNIIDLLKELANIYRVDREQLQAQLLIGDARQTIQQVLRSQFSADAIFLDPFSPPKCPQLWTVEFLSLVAKCLNSTAKIATYSCAASVRTALKLSKLQIGASVSIGKRSPGTVASFIDLDSLTLSDREREHLQTRAAIPYRDPQLKDSAETIRQRRKDQQQSSLLEPTSHWKKRWLTMAK
jgi:tRNA U34 5-methylaminomethyl-2-thiouridine-forming methyltransferase MnmC